MSELIERIRRRKLLQWAAGYAGGAWLLLQMLALVADPFGWPDSVIRAAIVIAVIGFLAVLVLAWYHGEKGHQRTRAVELALLAGVAAAAVVGILSVGRAPAAQADTQGATNSDRASIAVLP